jgi:hypothetical protein
MSDPDEDPTVPEDQEPSETNEDPSLLTTDKDSAGLWLPKGPTPKLPKPGRGRRGR